MPPSASSISGSACSDSPTHGARFDIESGKCVRGPCVGESLEALPLMLDAEGGIHVAIDEAVLEKPAALPRVTPTSA